MKCFNIYTSSDVLDDVIWIVNHRLEFEPIEVRGINLIFEVRRPDVDGLIEVANDRVQIQNLSLMKRGVYLMRIFRFSDHCAPGESADDVLDFVFE